MSSDSGIYSAISQNMLCSYWDVQGIRNKKQNTKKSLSLKDKSLTGENKFTIHLDDKGIVLEYTKNSHSSIIRKQTTQLKTGKIHKQIDEEIGAQK